MRDPPLAATGPRTILPAAPAAPAPAAVVPVLLKPEGEGRYTSTGPPETMFQHPQWKDVSAELFLRVDSSTWTTFGTHPIARHIGSKGVTP